MFLVTSCGSGGEVVLGVVTRSGARWVGAWGVIGTLIRIGTCARKSA